MTGEELKRFRSRLAWTQQRLADELGVTNDAVSRWERGEDKISKLVALAIRGLAAREGVQE